MPDESLDSFINDPESTMNRFASTSAGFLLHRLTPHLSKGIGRTRKDFEKYLLKQYNAYQNILKTRAVLHQKQAALREQKGKLN